MGGEGAPLVTCNTCGLGFSTSEVQRLHMKTEWHRYNLKRRVANLPPISSEVFQEKVLQQEHSRQLADEKTGRGSSGRSSGQRQVTKKDKKREEKMLRKIAEQEKLQKKKRDASPARSEASNADSTFSLGDPVSSYAPSLGDDDSDDGHVKDAKVPSSFGRALSDIDDTDEEEEALISEKLRNAVEIPPNVCLVDGKKFTSAEENVDYMTKKYSFFIPERQYLTDLDGLMSYLGEKVGLGNMCLYCNYQGKSVESVRAHMISKAHVKIPYDSTEDKLELGEFYDFTSTYKPKRAIVNEALGSTVDDEWEDEGSIHSSDDEDDEDFDESSAYIDNDGFELVLAPGMRAGHKSLTRYYKQKFGNGPRQTEGQTTVLAVDNRAGLVRERDAAQEKAQKFAWKEEKQRQNLYFRRDKFANNQPHYRDQLLQ